nr:hypothetical protein [Tanacetum cinerariifolium]
MVRLLAGGEGFRSWGTYGVWWEAMVPGFLWGRVVEVMGSSGDSGGVGQGSGFLWEKEVEGSGKLWEWWRRSKKLGGGCYRFGGSGG